MTNGLFTKLDEQAKNSDKGFLWSLVKELEKAKDKLSESSLTGIPPSVLNDLYNALEDAMAQSAIVICTNQDGICNLNNEDIRALHVVPPCF